MVMLKIISRSIAPRSRFLKLSHRHYSTPSAATATSKQNYTKPPPKPTHRLRNTAIGAGLIASFFAYDKYFDEEAGKSSSFIARSVNLLADDI
jgi:hypothetical protein